MSPGLSPTVALVYPGDTTDPRHQSGRPFHLARALEAHGCRVVRIRAAPPDAVVRVTMGVMRRTVGEAHANHGPEAVWLRTRAVRRRVGGLPPEVPLILIGTSFAPPWSRSYATYDDMTVVQALDHYADWRALPGWVAAARRRLQARIYRRATACCTTSAYAARSIVDDYGITPTRVHVVGLGGHDVRAPAARDWSTPRFLFVGRDWERKNGAAVVRAFAHLRAERPDATLDLVGEHPPQHGPGVHDHGLLPIDEPAARERLHRLYAESTCFVVPSRHEPTGIVFAEAAAAGLPMIGSRRGGTADVIGDAGVVVDPDDLEALTAAMRELAEPDRARVLGDRARTRAALFTWEAVAARMLLALGLGAPLGLEAVAPLPLGPRPDAPPVP